jgi:hypothetical protein
MAVTTTLVHASANHLVYLMSAAGAETGTIPCDGGATPDLQTDSPAGPIHQMSLVFDDGYGALPAGAQTQADIRAMLLSDDPTNLVGTNIARALITATPRSAITVAVDVDVDGSFKPEINVAFSGAGACYLVVSVPGAIGA